MEYLTFCWWDYLIFFVMISFSIGFGIYYGLLEKKQSPEEENLYVQRQMRVIPVGVSLVASAISILDLLAVPTEIYMHGTQFWIEVLSFPVMGAFVCFICLPVYYKLMLNSPFDYLELRFGKSIRRVVSLIFLVTAFLTVPIFIYAPSLILSQVSGFNLHFIAPAISLICIFYTTLGGLRAVIWADTLQFSITLCSLVVALVLGTISAGGIGNIWENAERGGRIEFFNMNPDPTIRTTFWNVFLGQTFRWTIFVIGYPAATQRLLSAPTLNDSRRVAIVFIIGMMITKSIMCFSGLIIYSKYIDCDPLSIHYVTKADQIVPYYVLDVSNQIPGLGTVFVAGLYSVALSVLSTILNIFACTAYMDFVIPFMPLGTTQEKGRNIIRIITVVVGVCGLCLVFVAENLGSLFELNYAVMGCSGGATLGMFLMGMLFPFANTKGIFYGGTVTLVFMLFCVIKTNIYVWKGAIKYEPKPLYTYGCIETLNETISAPSTTEEPFWLFKVSFHYYFLMGCLICMIVGLPISWITRQNDNRLVKPDMLSPVVQRFLPKNIAITRDDDSVIYVSNLLKKEENFVSVNE